MTQRITAIAAATPVAAMLALAAPATAAPPLAAAGQPVTTGEPSRVGPPWNWRTTFRVPGTDTDIAFGGYAKLDVLYDADVDLGEVTDPLQVIAPLGGNPTTVGRTTFTAKETRLNFRTRTDTRLGDLKTYVEAHFLPAGDFSIRHAYGRIGPFLLGRSWSNFMSFIATPRSAKLGSPLGQAFIRQAQARYSAPVGESGAFSVALEDPETVVAATPDAAPPETPLPDLTARYEYRRNLGVSAVVRQLATSDTAATDGESTVGYGVQVHGAVDLRPDTRLLAGVLAGEGLGHYYGPPSNRPGRLPDAYVDADGDVTAVESMSASLSLEHTWAPGWMSALSFTRLTQDLPDEPAFAGFAETVDYAFANVFWDATDRLSLGVELQRVDAERQDGATFDASRLQTSAIFQF